MNQCYVGLFGSAKAWLTARLARASRRLLVICKDQSSAEELASDLDIFIRPGKILELPEWDTLPGEPVSPQTHISATRIATLLALRNSSEFLTITSIQALMQRSLAGSAIEALCFEVTPNSPADFLELGRKFELCQYKRVSLVEEIGDLAIRGNVIDCFPADQLKPVRIELRDGTLHSIRQFDPDTQRSTQDLERLRICPVREALPYSANSPFASMLPAFVENLKGRAVECETPLREVQTLIAALGKEPNTPPSAELLQYLAEPNSVSTLDYLPSDTTIILNDQLSISREANEFWDLIQERTTRLASEHVLVPKAGDIFDTPKAIFKQLDQFTTHFIDNLAMLESQGTPAETVTLRSFANTELSTKLSTKIGTGNALNPLVRAINRWRRDDNKVGFIVGSPVRQERLQRLLLQQNIDAAPHPGAVFEWLDQADRFPVAILSGHINSGFTLPAEKLVLISENEIFGERSYRKSGRAKTNIKKLLSTLAQLKEGDFVVHIDYGIGLYQGLKHLTVEGSESDFLHIEYSDSRLYLPVQNIGSIQKFVAAEGQAPQLDKLGSRTWLKTKAKVRESVVELAGDLIKLYAERSVVKGWRFDPRGAIDEQFADDFAYDETPDQLQAIEQTLADMAQDKPMDRLVCGDVGFGKTEVGIRAAYKCTQHARQVAVLVPTTILVEQHRKNFEKRFESYEARVGAVSRFYSPKANKETLQKLADGELDIIIGTHRLLSRDVSFKDLGLVIIDEEHRFGVKQKERLKQMKRQVDVLTLTATPIPRTLHMSLLSIRDISLINTPPQDRRVIQTYIATFSEALIRDAILRELQRGGQCFFVHNRIDSIAAMTARLHELVPEARFAFGHGQMSETELEPIMQRFLDREIDVLVCTTIIESGLDIPNANTILIDRADTYGLAQLYQLRGRVGRSDRQAYAYLLIPKLARIGDEAQRRLKALQSLDDLGQGFNLAMRDLEIRGAGNLLGREQAGNVIAVGFELYTKILREAVLSLKGEELDLTEAIDPEVKLGLPAYIPDYYIPDISERLVLYQRLASIGSNQEADDLSREIEDRFGPPDVSVVNLIELMRLRAVLREYGIMKAELAENRFSLSFSSKAPLDVRKILALVKAHPDRYRFGRSLTFTIFMDTSKIINPAQLLAPLEAVFQQIGRQAR